IAGSDSGGGAGIQADLKTFSALGVYGMSAITAVTVQNTLGVSDYQELRPGIVADQIRSVASDIGVDAAKTGMLASAEIVRAVVGAVGELEIPNLVVDPVFVSKHGDPLLREEAVAAIRDELLPLATLVTPNLPEAGGLLGRKIGTPAEMEQAGRELLALGPKAVLVKGGHLDGGAADDLFVDVDGPFWLRAERIATVHTHGTGCTLSAAIAAELAKGTQLRDAVRSGKAFVTEAIRHAVPLGEGIGPVNPDWETRRG
ncbi:MAG: bifunctional hydroxymethylpyrimidine kinase/phosphomethylpyrimidine kinase, partial [Actinomycetota bacterium]